VLTVEATTRCNCALYQSTQDVRDLMKSIREEVLYRDRRVEDKKLNIIGWKEPQSGSAGHQGCREVFRERRQLEFRRP
jgi:hypothetical protein